MAIVRGFKIHSDVGLTYQNHHDRGIYNIVVFDQLLALI